MADFVGPVIDWFLGELRERTPDLLAAAGMEAFADYRRSMTGVWLNWPPVAVMPRKTDFDPQSTARHEVHAITIFFGVNGTDPDEVTERAMVYMKAIDDCLTAAEAAGEWPAGVTHIHIATHDYGPVWALEKGFARFPEMHIEVEEFEV